MLPYFSLGVKKKTKKAKRKKRLLFFVVVIILAFILGFFVINTRIMPSITALANQRLMIEINNAIDDSINQMFANLSMSDFFDYTIDNNGVFSSLSVNTILINQIASFMAVDISYVLSNEELMRVYVPIGIFTGLPIFAGVGPTIGINTIPSGEAQVQYETAFIQAGINQVNFQVWLNIEASMRVMVPLQETTINTDRRIAIVNTVFAGEVPAGMILSP